MITFEVAASSQIKPIPEIPDYKICRIEGRNGVGKSLAIRLLELATGSQPYGPHNLHNAWVSLKAQLSPFILKVDGLPNGKSLVWNANPGSWPAEALAPNDEWIGRFELDGEPITLLEVKQLIRVQRIVGDETLAEAISAPVRADRVHFRMFREDIGRAVDTLLDTIGRLAARLDTLDVSRAAEANNQLRNAEERIKVLVWKKHALAQEITELEKATNLSARLNKAQSDLPTIENEIDRHSASIEKLDGTLEQLEKQMQEASKAANQDVAISEQIKAKRENLIKAEDKLTRARGEIGRQLARLNSEIPSEQVETWLNSVAQSTRQLLGEKDQVYKAPHMRDLIKEILSAVARREQLGVDNEILMSSEASKVAVGEAVAMLQTRHRELAAAPQPQRLSEIEAELAELVAKKGALQELSSAYSSAASAETTIEKLKREASILEEKLDPSLRKGYEALQAEDAAVREERNAAIVELARFETSREMLLRYGGREDLAAQVAGLEQSLGASQNWSPDLSKKRQDLAAIDYEIVQREPEIQDLKETLDLELSAVKTAHFQASREAPWILQHVGTEKTDDAPEGASIAGINALKLRLSGLKEDLDTVRRRAVAAEGTLDFMIEELEGRTSVNLRTDAYLSHIQDIYNSALAQQFKSDKIREVLFDGGAFSRLDVETRTVFWSSSAGEGRSRPLEAFSSGEYAYAYTLARLESIDLGNSSLRIVALDEFGAFLERDRLDQLMRFVRERVLGEIADRVIVILPLVRNYVQNAETSSDPAAKDLAKQVIERGYVALDQNEALSEGGL